MNSDISTNPPLANEPTVRRDWYVQIQSADGEIQLMLPSLVEANAETGWMGFGNSCSSA
jgi:hypothetical protein